MPYCLLCGNYNLGFLPFCLRCKIPRGRGYDKDVPAGWESCQIVGLQIEQLGPDEEVACYVVEVYTPRSTYLTHRSETFTHRIWRDWEDEPPPPLSKTERQILHEMRATLLTEGWQDVIVSNGGPSKYKFWRRMRKRKQV